MLQSDVMKDAVSVFLLFFPQLPLIHINIKQQFCQVPQWLQLLDYNL